MNKSQRAALFVFLSLLVTLVGGAILYFGYAGSFATAVPSWSAASWRPS
ncbi:hypothetical protein AB0M54_30505 [Actinoplanes sp. NPDC051470]